jgi:hypothetical protein
MIKQFSFCVIILQAIAGIHYLFACILHSATSTVLLGMYIVEGVVFVQVLLAAPQLLLSIRHLGS